MTNEENHAKVTEAVDHIKGYIRQYEEGLITSHEMANASFRKVVTIQNHNDQGCDGLPPNDILPTGERDNGMVHVG